MCNQSPASRPALPHPDAAAVDARPRRTPPHRPRRRDPPTSRVILLDIRTGRASSHWVRRAEFRAPGRDHAPAARNGRPGRRPRRPHRPQRGHVAGPQGRPPARSAHARRGGPAVPQRPPTAPAPPVADSSKDRAGAAAAPARLPLPGPRPRGDEQAYVSGRAGPAGWRCRGHPARGPSHPVRCDAPPLRWWPRGTGLGMPPVRAIGEGRSRAPGARDRWRPRSHRGRSCSRSSCWRSPARTDGRSQVASSRDEARRCRRPVTERSQGYDSVTDA